MAASSRVGPSVLVVHERAREGDPARLYADELNEDGFTALAVDLPSDSGDRTDAILEAGASFLSENWHPRLGIVAFGSRVGDAIRLAGEAGAEAVVAYLGDVPASLDAGDLPAMAHVWGPGHSPDLQSETGWDEICFHARDSAEEETAAALAQTLDFLHYHLS
jgi:dienelactone hydrolase